MDALELGQFQILVLMFTSGETLGKLLDFSDINFPNHPCYIGVYNEM